MLQACRSNLKAAVVPGVVFAGAVAEKEKRWKKKRELG
jgi:hypothetical protein